MARIILVMAMISLPEFVTLAQDDSLSLLEPKKHSFGIGLGSLYGRLGGNVDVNVATNFNLSLGLGTTLEAGFAYNLGGKYFFLPVTKGFRPRLSAFYGTNTLIRLPKESRKYSGLNLGLGFQWMWGETRTNGLDFDVLYPATSTYDEEALRKEGFIVELRNTVLFSIGYRRAF